MSFHDLKNSVPRIAVSASDLRLSKFWLLDFRIASRSAHLRKAGEFPNISPMENKPAGFWTRFVAMILDGIILGVISLPLTLVQYGVMAYIKSSSGEEPSMIQVAILTVCTYLFAGVIQFVYYAAFYKSNGATPGKRMLGLRVIDVKTGGNPGWSQTFNRECVGKVISGLILGIGYFMAGLRSDKRALHDLMAHTQVVQVPAPNAI